MCPALAVGSLSLVAITDYQAGPVWNWLLIRHGYWAIAMIPAFLLFYTAGLAAAKRAPFDLPEAESELTAGFHTEYSGMRFGMFFLPEYALMLSLSAVTSVLFLGGYHDPFGLSAPGGMFAEARKSDMDLEDIGERLAARKQELEENGTGERTGLVRSLLDS